MTRGQKTTVKELKPGDRFYKATDKLKTPFQLIGTQSLNRFEVCEAEYIKNGSAPLNRIRTMTALISVIFLRNVNH